MQRFHWKIEAVTFFMNDEIELEISSATYYEDKRIIKILEEVHEIVVKKITRLYAV